MVETEQPLTPIMNDNTTPKTIGGQNNLPSNTTLAQDLTHAGQRRVNLIWESTQAAVAIIITLAVVYSAVSKITSQELTNAFFLIVGFYFSRTNHSQIGGIGEKPNSEYKGR